MAKFKDRRAATEFIREQGIPIGDQRLAELRHQEIGPRFSIINGRALYAEEDLLHWIETEIASRAFEPKSKSARKQKSPDSRNSPRRSA